MPAPLKLDADWKILNNITPVFIGIDKYFELKGGGEFLMLRSPKFLNTLVTFGQLQNAQK